MEVAETRKLRWSCGVTKLDLIGNGRIRGATKVGGALRSVVEMVWACAMKRRAILWKWGDGNGSTVRMRMSGGEGLLEDWTV